MDELLDALFNNLKPDNPLYSLYYGHSGSDGSGYGYNPTAGYGYGEAFRGGGCGEGESHGYGFESGDGYGAGHGYGYGTASEDGDGYGIGGGTVISHIGELEVISYDFGLIAVGCEIHTLSSWRKQWRDIAEQNKVSVSEKEVNELFLLVKELSR